MPRPGSGAGIRGSVKTFSTVIAGNSASFDRRKIRTLSIGTIVARATFRDLANRLIRETNGARSRLHPRRGSPFARHPPATGDAPGRWPGLDRGSAESTWPNRSSPAAESKDAPRDQHVRVGARVEHSIRRRHFRGRQDNRTTRSVSRHAGEGTAELPTNTVATEVVQLRREHSNPGVPLRMRDRCAIESCAPCNSPANRPVPSRGNGLSRLIRFSSPGRISCTEPRLSQCVVSSPGKRSRSAVRDANARLPRCLRASVAPVVPGRSRPAPADWRFLDPRRAPLALLAHRDSISVCHRTTHAGADTVQRSVVPCGQICGRAGYRLRNRLVTCGGLAGASSWGHDFTSRGGRSGFDRRTGSRSGTGERSQDRCARPYFERRHRRCLDCAGIQLGCHARLRGRRDRAAGADRDDPCFCPHVLHLDRLSGDEQGGPGLRDDLHVGDEGVYAPRGMDGRLGHHRRRHSRDGKSRPGRWPVHFRALQRQGHRKQRDERLGVARRRAVDRGHDVDLLRRNRDLRQLPEGIAVASSSRC